MGVDEARDENRVGLGDAACAFELAFDFSPRANGEDLWAFDRDGTIVDDTALGIHRDNGAGAEDGALRGGDS
jgi:hypothetical protein